MTKAANIEAIEEKTGITWAEWTKLLNAAGADELSHRQIADIAYAKLEDTLENAGWWSQSVAVAYEQEIGRRAPGQRSDGTYEFSITKTVDADMDKTMQVWLDLINNATEFNGVAITKAATSTATDKRRHWGCGLADGTRLNADVYPKSADKCSLSVTQQKLTSQAKADAWKSYWKTQLDKI